MHTPKIHIPRTTVVVGMSGGVDSSVTAYLLKQQGYRVIGLFMKNWNEEDANGVCPATLDYEDVVTICQQLDIPHYSVDFSKNYWDSVFTHFLEEYSQGYTPNPDILCNREIKFKVFFEHAREMGADFLATGHYCQIGMFENEPCLLRGRDPGKDQSYFLYTLKSAVLRHVLFPIGHLLKSEVRQIAAEQKLITATKKDSTGICFIGKRNFKEFLGKHLAFTPGNFENSQGKIIGQHSGVAYYTIGQRKGLAIGGPGEAWFVVGKDVPRNVVIIEQGEDHPALYKDALDASEISWVSTTIPSFPLDCTCKIRYRQPDAPCKVERDGEQLHVSFATPQKAVTSRQSVVFYAGERCLGGGMII